MLRQSRITTPALPISPWFVRIAGKQRDLVAVRITKIADVEMGAVRRPKTRPPVVGAARGQRGAVKVADLFLRSRLERDHYAVPR